MNIKIIVNAVRTLARYLNHPATTFSLGAVFIMFVDTYITKGIDSSFVSAVMDTVMAVATVLAVLAAKNYLNQSAKQDGYKIALSILNDRFVHTGLLSFVVKDLVVLELQLLNYRHIDGVFKNTPESFKRIRERKYIISMSKLHKSLNISLKERIFELNQQIQFDIFKMRNTGIDFNSNEHGLLMKQHLSSYRELTLNLDGYLEDLKLYLLKFYDYSHSDFYDEEKIKIPDDRESFSESVNELLLRIGEIKKTCNELVSGVNEVTVSKKTVFEYFNLN